MAMAALALTACQQEQDDLSPAAIELTTPVIELNDVQASTRAALDATTVIGANINLYLHDSEARKFSGRRGVYSDDNFSDGINWTANPSVTVTGGEGDYRAGISATISLNATETMPIIANALYAYRGSINVEADGTFTPDDTLEPYSAAVLLKLKDADGNIIDPVKYDTPDGENTEGAMDNGSVYLIKPVGLTMMDGFVADTEGQSFPNGTANPVPNAITSLAYLLTYDYANGDFTPGTYPATWTERILVTSATPSTAWPLFEVTYCKDGFEWTNAGLVPKGTVTTTWTVNYPAEQLTLEPGKLYTFTATLGANAHITLDAEESVTISDWATGETINIGR